MFLNKKLIASALSALFVSGAAVATVTTSVTLDANSSSLTADPVLRKVFVANYDSGTVSVVDVDTLATQTYPVTANPRLIVSDAAHQRLYLVNDLDAGRMTVLNSATGEIVASIALGRHPQSVAADFRRGELYVPNIGGTTLSIVDTASNTVSATVDLGVTPSGVEVNTRLKKIYVVSALDRSVSVIDQASRAIVAKVMVGASPAEPTVDERTGKVYVNNVDDQTVSVIEPSANTVAATIPAGAGSTTGITSAVYHRYYLPNAASETLSIVDTDTDEVVATLGVGATPLEAQVDGSGGDIYVVNQASNSVTVVDARTEVPADAVGVGSHPWRIALAMGRVFALADSGAAADTLSVMPELDSQKDTAIATEYYNATTDQYFHTADGVEVRTIADGKFGQTWDRTMEFFRVWTNAASGRAPVCRFVRAGLGATNTHYFTVDAKECEAMQESSAWKFEGVAYYVVLPDATGACPDGSERLYRVYDGAAVSAPEYRYTADFATQKQMLARGWVADGVGTAGVFACTAPLEGVAGDVAAATPVVDGGLLVRKPIPAPALRTSQPLSGP